MRELERDTADPIRAALWAWLSFPQGCYIIEQGSNAETRLNLPDKEAENKRVEENAFFKAGNFSAAIKSYTTAILLAPKSHILPSNGSLSHLRLTPPNCTPRHSDDHDSPTRVW
ncbi:hypothetical protein T439DRAFT_359957 [Meredithblackwellia eburnea MCA 4105]